MLQERHWKNFVEGFCVEDVKVLGIYWHFTLSLLVWIPLSLMLLTVSLIFFQIVEYKDNSRNTILTIFLIIFYQKYS